MKRDDDSSCIHACVQMYRCSELKVTGEEFAMLLAQAKVNICANQQRAAVLREEEAQSKSRHQEEVGVR